MNVHMYVYAYTCLDVCAWMCACMHIRYKYESIYVCMNAYACMDVYMHACMCLLSFCISYLKKQESKLKKQKITLHKN